MHRPTFGYDIITPRGELPNGLDPARFKFIYDQVKWNFKEILYFNSLDTNPVYLAGHFDHKIIKKSVYEIHKNRQQGINEIWYYAVEPFGNFRGFLGMLNEKVDDEFTLHVSDVAKHEIIAGNGRLLINYTIDGGIDVNRKTITKLFELLKATNIPFRKIYFLMNDINFKGNLEKISGIGNLNVFHFNLALMQKSNEIYNTLLHEGRYFFWRNNTSFVSKVTRIEDFESNLTKKDKKFLMLNRNWKMHRLELIKTLRDNGLLEDSLVSWDKNMFSHSEARAFIEKYNDAELMEIMKNNSSILDYPDIANVHGYGFETKEIYLQSFFHIVGETIYYQDDIPSGYVSEKPFKPMAHFQPFIFAGPAGVIKHLNELGFKSFHPYIDETYDSITDDNERMKAISNEVIRLGKLTKDEMIDITLKLKSVLYHNYRTLFNIGSPKLQDDNRNNVIEFLNKL